MGSETSMVLADISTDNTPLVYHDDCLSAP